MTIDSANRGNNRQYAFNEFAVLRHSAPRRKIPEPATMALLAKGIAPHPDYLRFEI